MFDLYQTDLIDLVTIDTDDPGQADDDIARIDFLYHRFLESCTATLYEGIDKQKQQLQKQHRPSQKNSKPTNKSRSNGKRRKKPLCSSFLRAKVDRVIIVINRFAALLQRSWRQNVRNTRVNLLRLSSSVIQAGLFASIFTSVRDGKMLP